MERRILIIIYASVFIARNGSDSDQGTADAPLRTLKAAIDAISKMKKDGEGVIVYFWDGTYTLGFLVRKR